MKPRKLRMKWYRPALFIQTIEVQDPVFLCCVLYLFLLRDFNFFLRISLLSSVWHECGHIVTYYCFTHTMPTVRISVTGLCMKTKGMCLSPHQMALLAVAGPAFNLVLAWICLLWLQQHVTVGCAAVFSANILLAVFNLLPIPPLDGFVVAEYFLRNCSRKLHFHRK